VAIDEVWAVHASVHNPNCLTVGGWCDAQIAGVDLRAWDDLGRGAWCAPSAPPEPLSFPTDRLVLADLATRARKSP